MYISAVMSLINFPNIIWIFCWGMMLRQPQQNIIFMLIFRLEGFNHKKICMPWSYLQNKWRSYGKRLVNYVQRQFLNTFLLYFILMGLLLYINHIIFVITHICLNCRLKYKCLTTWYWPLLSAAPPFMIRATRMAPVSSSRLIVAPYKEIKKRFIYKWVKYNLSAFYEVSLSIKRKKQLYTLQTIVWKREGEGERACWFSGLLPSWRSITERITNYFYMVLSTVT